MNFQFNPFKKNRTIGSKIGISGFWLVIVLTYIFIYLESLEPSSGADMTGLLMAPAIIVGVIFYLVCIFLEIIIKTFIKK